MLAWGNRLHTCPSHTTCDNWVMYAFWYSLYLQEDFFGQPRIRASHRGQCPGACKHTCRCGSAVWYWTQVCQHLSTGDFLWHGCDKYWMCIGQIFKLHSQGGRELEDLWVRLFLASCISMTWMNYPFSTSSWTLGELWLRLMRLRLQHRLFISTSFLPLNTHLSEEFYIHFNFQKMKNVARSSWPCLNTFSMILTPLRRTLMR